MNIKKILIIVNVENIQEKIIDNYEYWSFVTLGILKG